MQVTTSCGRGGTGRRARFRSWSRKGWRFKSSRPHVLPGQRGQEPGAAAPLDRRRSGPVRPVSRTTSLLATVGIETGDRLDHPVLLLLGEMRPHWQAQHLMVGNVELRKDIGHGSELAERPLAVGRNGVMNALSRRMPAPSGPQARPGGAP